MADNCVTFRSHPHDSMQNKKPAAACPCGGPSYAACCAPLIDGETIAATAEMLMRSRYTAYTLGKEAYLRATWHPSTCPSEPIVGDGENVQWLGLEVKSAALRLRKRNINSRNVNSRNVNSPNTNSPNTDSPAVNAVEDNEDSVEFVARYKIGGRAQRLHEVSRFVREHGRWFYLDGSFPS
jgi:SEC-C motif-containing protein